MNKLILKRMSVGLRRQLGEVSSDSLARISQMTLRPVTAEDVAVYTISVCNDRPDHFNTQFRRKALDSVARLIIGKGLFRNHQLWESGDLAIGRCFDARVVNDAGITTVEADTYIPRCSELDGIIARMDLQVIHEVSLQWWSYPVECSICGRSPYDVDCSHAMGKDYDGKLAVGEIPDVHDVVEYSLVWKGGQVNTKIEGKRSADTSDQDLGELMMRCADKQCSDGLAHLFERQDSTPAGLDHLFRLD